MLDEVVDGGAELAHGGGAALESLAGGADLLGGAFARLVGSGDGLQLIRFLRQGLGGGAGAGTELRSVAADLLGGCDDVGEGGHSGAPVSCLEIDDLLAAVCRGVERALGAAEAVERLAESGEHALLVASVVAVQLGRDEGDGVLGLGLEAGDL